MLLYQVKWINPHDDDFAVLASDLESQVKRKGIFSNFIVIRDDMDFGITWSNWGYNYFAETKPHSWHELWSK